MMAALEAMRLIYGNSAMLTAPVRYLQPVRKKPIETFDDAEAVIQIINDEVAQWNTSQDLLHDALQRARFCLETVRLKRKKHKEKWFANWRSLNIDDDRSKLVYAVRVLEKRYSLVCMGRPINADSVVPTHALPDTNRHVAPDHTDSRGHRRYRSRSA